MSTHLKKSPLTMLTSRLSTAVITSLIFPSVTWAAGAVGCVNPGDANAKPGVLTAARQPNFACYLQSLLSGLIPYVLTLAMIMIVFSGVQYMLAGVSPEGQKAAKQRIIGIITGVIFYFAIQFFLRQLTGSITFLS